MLLTIGLFLTIFIASQILIIRFNGESVDQTVVSREPNTIGTGKKLRYVVAGDSTAASVGSTYEKGITTATANHLALNYQVEYMNTAVSGATTQDVVKDQLDKILEFSPDLVLISVGANDVTHLTRRKVIDSNLNLMIEKLIDHNCNIKIVLTGSPDMGSIPRFPQPIRHIAGIRTVTVNRLFIEKVQRYDLTFASIASETGPIFRREPRLFAADKFHPNEAGYATWKPVLNQALTDALKRQPSHCSG